MKFNFAQFAILLTIITLNASFAAEAQTNGEPVAPNGAARTADNYTEIGVTLGTPAGFNFVLGYWADAEFPWLLRASGMYYGEDLRGVQGDFGWVFSREHSFKQFVAVSVGSSQVSSDFHHIRFTGVGPTYGFNWGGFTLQAGILFGTYLTLYNDGVTTSQSSVQLFPELGYTWLIH